MINGYCNLPSKKKKITIKLKNCNRLFCGIMTSYKFVLIGGHMGWFLSFQIAGLVLLLVIVGIVCYIKKENFFAFMWDNFKWIMLAELIVIIAITIGCAKMLYNTTHCYFRGKSMKAETKYSWYLQECQVKTRRGSYVPIRTSRGLPVGVDES